MYHRIAQVLLPALLYCATVEANEPGSVSTTGVAAINLIVPSESVVPSRADDQSNHGVSTERKALESTPNIGGGYSGSWFNPEQSGHGFSFQVTPTGSMVVYWFTYDSQGDPMFLIGVGEAGKRGARINMRYVSGMPFGLFDPADVRQEHWGTLRIAFAGCDSGVVSYDSGFADRHGAKFGSGTIPITRLSAIGGTRCREPIEDIESALATIQGTGSTIERIDVYVDGERLGSLPTEISLNEFLLLVDDLLTAWEVSRGVTESRRPLEGDIYVEYLYAD